MYFPQYTHRYFWKNCGSIWHFPSPIIKMEISLIILNWFNLTLSKKSHLHTIFKSIRLYFNTLFLSLPLSFLLFQKNFFLLFHPPFSCVWIYSGVILFQRDNYNMQHHKGNFHCQNKYKKIYKLYHKNCHELFIKLTNTQQIKRRIKTFPLLYCQKQANKNTQPENKGRTNNKPFILIRYNWYLS